MSDTSITLRATYSPLNRSERKKILTYVRELVPVSVPMLARVSVRAWVLVLLNNQINKYNGQKQGMEL